MMGAVGDPVGTGLIVSLARPGGNVTGVSSAASEVAGKSLELIRELFPSARGGAREGADMILQDAVVQRPISISA